MNQLVIGCGEVGSAVAGLLQADKCDVNVPAPREQYNVIHVCFPYSAEFVQDVAAYREQFQPELTVIHSTVPLGTSRQCGAVHSPVRGKHPNLLESLKVFVKFFGGERANEAAALFSQCSCVCVPNQETTEALKLWDTTIYGVNIALEKTIHEWCKKNGVDFQTVYTHANETYNAGYAAMGNPEYCKYVLSHVGGPIKGHCVRENSRLLGLWTDELIQSAGVGEQEPVVQLYRDDFACKVCGNWPDETGYREHGRGCYTQHEDGGGADYVEEAEGLPLRPIK